ncbi:MAG: Mur ligase family protein, partial [Thermomicrobiales bacterium]
MKTLEELGRLSNAAGTSGDLSVAPTGIAYDSRQIRPGDLFVALRGGYFDGHAFLEEAIHRGAVAIAAEIAHPHAPSLVYKDMRTSLPTLSAAFFGFPARELRLVGITGTDGKTTTSYLAEWILARNGATTGMIGTVTVKIGEERIDHSARQTTPESLDIQRYLAQMRDAGVEWAVLEATSHGLAAHRLDELTFAIGAVTNVTHEHLEFHGTIDAYRRAKASLVERVAASGGYAVLNLDDPVSRSFQEVAVGANVLTYSRLDTSASISALNVVSDVTGSRFDIACDWGTRSVRMPFPGEFNVENALCATSIGLAANVELELIGEALETVPLVPGRMVRVDEGQPFTVIVDYAHTPESLEKILLLLRRFTDQGRVICVSGSAGERDTEKRPMQGEISARLSDFSIFTTEDP